MGRELRETWLSQIASFIVANYKIIGTGKRHHSGSFTNLKGFFTPNELVHYDVAERMKDWEADYQETVTRYYESLRGLVQRLRLAAKNGE